jgi:DNA-binding ferritin-like protein (Dps family)
MKMIKRFLNWCKKVRTEKRIFRAYRKRVKALPNDYQVVFSEIEGYIWNFAMDGMIDVLSDIVTLFEEGAADKKPVLEITGEDILGFVDGILEDLKNRTWQGKVRETFNKRIHKKLEALKDEHEDGHEDGHE